MAIRLFGADPSARGADQEPLAQQVRLVGVLDGRGLFATGVRQGRQAHRLVGELPAEQAQDPAVDLVQPVLVDAEQLERFDHDRVIHDPVTLHGSEVAHSSQQTIGNTRRTAAA